MGRPENIMASMYPFQKQHWLCVENSGPVQHFIREANKAMTESNKTAQCYAHMTS